MRIKRKSLVHIPKLKLNSKHEIKHYACNEINDIYRIYVVTLPIFQYRSEKTYLSYKTDDNAIGQRSRIWLREVQEDGITFANENEAATLIMSADFQEDKLVVEGGSLLYRHGYYYLFFSADGYLSPTYHINVARSKTVPISQLKLYFHNFFNAVGRLFFGKIL